MNDGCVSRAELPAEYARFVEELPEKYPSSVRSHPAWKYMLEGIESTIYIFVDYPEVCNAIDNLRDNDPNDQAALAILTRVQKSKPRWDSLHGELWLRGVVARRVAPQATNLRTIVNSFTPGWPRWIDDPFADADKLHRALGQLRLGLRGIRFRTDGTGKRVGWLLTDPLNCMSN